MTDRTALALAGVVGIFRFGPVPPAPPIAAYMQEWRAGAADRYTAAAMIETVILPGRGVQVETAREVVFIPCGWAWAYPHRAGYHVTTWWPIGHREFGPGDVTGVGLVGGASGWTCQPEQQ